MTLTTTLNRIRAHSPCAEGWEKLLAGLGKTKPDDEPLAYATIARIIGLDDALWCCRVEPQYAREWRLFAVWCARQFEYSMTDQRSRDVLDVAERHANGLASDEELNAAWTAAIDATWNATGAATWEAAWEAAWATWMVAGEAAWMAAGDVAGDTLLTHFIEVVGAEPDNEDQCFHVTHRLRIVAQIRIAEIDKMFAEAKCWGPWMVMCANEREDLADMLNAAGIPIEHKNQAR